MKKPNHDLHLPVGNISLSTTLGKYYQDFSEAMFHFENDYFGDTDDDGLPLCGFGDKAFYNQIYIIQYGLILHDFILDGRDIKKNTEQLQKCIGWLEAHKEEFKATTVWRNNFYLPRYDLSSGWISSMYQGQIISLYLRYGQLINEEDLYIEKARSIYNFFEIPFEEGGVKRFDANGLLWFEEYPSSEPSFVLNGYIYTLLGIYDLWRASGDIEIKKTIDSCVTTLKSSLHLYDSGYWSVYDQQKKELATKYYHQNIHIPLMDVLYKLTDEEIFNSYKKRWEKQLNSKFNKVLVPIMYRIQPRLRRFLK